jgi:membrane associated rhomboid family serine protease
MAVMDLGALLLLGAWLESRSRRLVLVLFAGGALLIGLGVHLLMADMETYRGASGIASALFVAAALGLFARSDGRASRWVVAGALGVFLAKVSWEALTGEALAAGPLPAGVGVAPRVHLLGAALGALTWLLLRRRRD